MLTYIEAPAKPEIKEALTPAGLPRSINSRLGGYSIDIIHTAEETDGKLLEVEVLMEPKGGNDLHYHTTFEEVFFVLEGVLGIQLEKEILHLGPGQSAKAPLHKLHRFFNPSETEPVRFRVVVTPPRSFEACLRIVHGLANDGKTNKEGIPTSLWHLALVFQMGETYVPLLPHTIQTGLSTMLARIARWLGKDKELEKYYKSPSYASPLTAEGAGRE
jgi:mannose-6-phosphate isomerase-like protein (cupin superfamily)